MKKILLFALCCLLFSCTKINYDGKCFNSYDMYVDYSLNQLKSPVVITSIVKKYTPCQNTVCDTVFFVTVKDSEKKSKFMIAVIQNSLKI